LRDNLLLCVTLCFIAGASTAFHAHGMLRHQPLICEALPLLLVLAIIAWRLPRRHAPLTTLPFFFLAGLLHTHLALQPNSDSHHISNRITARTQVTLVGRIVAMPEFDGDKTRFELAIESLLIHDRTARSPFQPSRGSILLSVPGRLAPEFTPGTMTMVVATVDRIRNYQTPGAFDYRLQMAAKSLRCSGWISSTSAVLLVGDSNNSFWRTLRFVPEQVRQRIAQALDHQFEADLAGLYQALLIGSLSNVSPQLLEAFKENGTFHILSISGLHFSLLGLFSTALFTFLLKRSQWLLLHTHVPTLALALTAPLLFFYTFIAGLNIPAIRALAMALLVLFAVILRRQRSLLPLIAAAALVVLAISPLALFTASFQLSFAAVLSINLIYPRLPILISDADTEHAWYKQLQTGLKTVQSLLYVSLAATAGTVPILLYHFNRFSLIGPLMNLLIEPLLCLWALPFGLVAIPFIWLAPDLSHVLFYLGSLGIELAVGMTNWADGFSFASVWTITPNIWEIVLYVSLLWLLLQRRLTMRRTLLTASLTVLLLGLFTRGLWRPPTRDELAVYFLDIGQGTATLLQLPGGKNILVDGGGYRTERFDPGQSIIAPFLWRQRIWRLDDLIVTHPHGDHYNGLPFVVGRFKPRRLIVNDDPGKEPAYDRFLSKVRQAGIPIQTAVAGGFLQQDNMLRVHCLGMPGLLDNASWSTNDRSLVLHVQYGKHGFLLPADIGIPSENRLLQSPVPLRAEVLLAPHHGSRTSGGPDFIAAVDPALIVVSTGQRQGISLPLSAHLERWRQKNILALITAQDGTITCRTDGNTLRVSSFNGKCFDFDAVTGKFVEKKRGLKEKILCGILNN